MKLLIFLMVFVICVTYLEAVITCPPSNKKNSNEDGSNGYGEKPYNVTAQLDCYHYCTVHRNNVELHECPVGLQYDVVSNQCVAGLNCPNSRCPPVQSDKSAYVRAPLCSEFYECSNGRAVLLSCPDGLNWNLDKEVCDYPPTDCIDLPVPE